MTLVRLGESDRSRLLLGNSITFNAEAMAKLGVVMHPIIRSSPSELISDSYFLSNTGKEVAIPPYHYILFEVLQNDAFVLEPFTGDQLKLRKSLEMLYTLNDPDLRHGLVEATLDLQQSAESLRINTMSEISAMNSLAAPIAKFLSEFRDEEYVKAPGSKHSPKIVFFTE